ncbi:hypothetical protein BDW74DRAFT_159365 [Aspergillus multicolor]|uniref:uncharacterized protein n=1 Tax=Aspergillus multicolor TaxID=41759 RepID=UPI003CCCFE1C
MANEKRWRRKTGQSSARWSRMAHFASSATQCGTFLFVVIVCAYKLRTIGDDRRLKEGIALHSDTGIGDWP